MQNWKHLSYYQKKAGNQWESRVAVKPQKGKERSLMGTAFQCWNRCQERGQILRKLSGIMTNWALLRSQRWSWIGATPDLFHRCPGRTLIYPVSNNCVNRFWVAADGKDLNNFNWQLRAKVWPPGTPLGNMLLQRPGKSPGWMELEPFGPY